MKFILKYFGVDGRTSARKLLPEAQQCLIYSIASVGFQSTGINKRLLYGSLR
jgi:hypothetical protein